MSIEQGLETASAPEKSETGPDGVEVGDFVNTRKEQKFVITKVAMATETEGSVIELQLVDENNEPVADSETEIMDFKEFRARLSSGAYKI